jgi:GNAT superfamily N-acetyltransferase
MKTDEITIRPIEANDAEAIALLWLTCTAEVAMNEPIYTPYLSAEELADHLKSEFISGQKFGWVAEMGSELAGYVTCEVQEEEPRFQPRRYIYVADLDVAEAYRRRGLSRALMAEVEREAHAKGIPRLELAAAYGDARSRMVWERHGFRGHLLHMHKDLGEE